MSETTQTYGRRYSGQMRLKLSFLAPKKKHNPFENLWYDLKNAVHQQNPSSNGVVCLEEWAKIPGAGSAKLIDAYPKRLAAVIAAKGGSTKY